MHLFTVNCLTCRRRLKVLDAKALGRIVACPNCGSMVPIVAPNGWQPAETTEQAASALSNDLGPAVPHYLAVCSSLDATTAAGAPHAVFTPVTKNAGDVASTSPSAARAEATDGGLDLSQPVLPAALATRAIFWRRPMGVATVAGSSLAVLGLLVVGGWMLTRSFVPQQPPSSDGTQQTQTAVATSETAAPEAKLDEVAANEMVVQQVQFDQEVAVVELPADTDETVAQSAVEPRDADVEPADLPPTAAMQALDEPANKPRALTSDSEDQAAMLGDAGRRIPREMSFSLQPIDVQARLQDEIVRFRCEGMPLRKFTATVTQFCGVAITIDVESLVDAGVPLNTAVTLDQRNVSVAQLLSAALQPLGLSYQIVGDQLVVQNDRPDRDEISVERYDVRAFVGSGLTVAGLADLVPRIILPGTWQADGGRGELQVAGEMLVVTHVPAAQRRVAGFLARWKSVRSGTSEQRQTQVQLGMPLTITFHRPTRLTRLLSNVERAGESQFFVDWRSLQAAGIPPTVEGTVSAHEQPLSELLTKLLQPWGAGYRVVGPNMLEIASLEDLQIRRELEFHPVADLAANTTAGDDLVARLRAKLALSPDATLVAGVLAFDVPSQTILANQPGDLQRGIDQLLEEWRAEAENR